MTQTLSNASAGKTGRSGNKDGEENGKHTEVSGSPQQLRGNGTVETENTISTMEVPIMVEQKEVGADTLVTMGNPIQKVEEVMESKS